VLNGYGTPQTGYEGMKIRYFCWIGGIEHLTLKLKLNIEHETWIKIQRWDNSPIGQMSPYILGLKIECGSQIKH
jgi:hypothetical protein